VKVNGSGNGTIGRMGCPRPDREKTRAGRVFRYTTLSARDAQIFLHSGGYAGIRVERAADWWYGMGDPGETLITLPLRPGSRSGFDNHTRDDA